MARIILFLTTAVLSFNGWSDSSLGGEWQYDSYRYRGVVSPPADPTLIMRFQFNDTGTDDLSWKDSSGTSCERRATFVAANGQINENVTWANPQNSADCASDPNMQVGSPSQFAYRIVNEQLEIDADLGDETITYLWRRVK